MKKVMLLVFAVIFSAGSAHAVEAVDFFGAIFNIIENQINKDKPGSSSSNNKVILKETENKIVLGRVFVTPNKNSDTVYLPECGNRTGNKKVTRLRLVVRNEDVFVEAFRVKYGNGSTETFTLNRGFNDGETSRWFNLSGGVGRCVVGISARGQVASNHNGGNGKPGFSFNFGNGTLSFNNGNSNHNHRAVLNFVGLKDSGFPF